ncbi:hypothetical protein B0H12DRAFT_1132787 [Mycena haematopus]|nr:hypothetical protein B0H12DRAFT_1132787 [Mycena haematopus]
MQLNGSTHGKVTSFNVQVVLAITVAFSSCPINMPVILVTLTMYILESEFRAKLFVL